MYIYKERNTYIKKNIRANTLRIRDDKVHVILYLPYNYYTLELRQDMGSYYNKQ